MTVFQRKARDGKIAFTSILPAVDPDCTHCSAIGNIDLETILLLPAN